MRSVASATALATQLSASSRPLVDWRRRLRDHGAEVRVKQVEQEAAAEVFVGSTLRVTASVYLGGLSPADLRVQIYNGGVDADGHITGGTPLDMKHMGMSGAEHLYEGTIECCDSGSRGFAVRVIAHHEDAILPYEQPWVVWHE